MTIPSSVGINVQFDLEINVNMFKYLFPSVVIQVYSLLNAGVVESCKITAMYVRGGFHPDWNSDGSHRTVLRSAGGAGTGRVYRPDLKLCSNLAQCDGSSHWYTRQLSIKESGEN